MSNPNAAREQYFYDFLNTFHEEFLEGETRPPYRICCGIAPHTQAGAKELGVCFNRASSSDKHNEMFLNPLERNTTRMLATAIHEYCHAIDDCKSGHRGNFRRLALMCGLTGPMKATIPGDELAEYIEWYISEHGDIPAGHMIASARAKPKQGTRMIKVECTNTYCEFNFRTSAKQLAKLPPYAACPACGEVDGLQWEQ